MHVEVVFDAGPGCLSKVHSDVDPVWLVGAPQHALQLCDPLRQLASFSFSKLLNPAKVTIGNDEDMSWVVRVKVEHRKANLSAANNEMALVVPLKGGTKDAYAFISLMNVLYVGPAPRRKKRLHRATSRLWPFRYSILHFFHENLQVKKERMGRFASAVWKNQAAKPSVAGQGCPIYRAW
jgi:hypothetical protein